MRLPSPWQGNFRQRQELAKACGTVKFSFWRRRDIQYLPNVVEYAAEQHCKGYKSNDCEKRIGCHVNDEGICKVDIASWCIEYKRTADTYACSSLDARACKEVPNCSFISKHKLCEAKPSSIVRDMHRFVSQNQEQSANPAHFSSDAYRAHNPASQQPPWNFKKMFEKLSSWPTSDNVEQSPYPQPQGSLI